MPAQEKSSRANSNSAIAADDRQLIITRTFDAPRDLVWKVWTDIEHARHWWGPKGFTLPFLEVDGRVGGTWRATMRSPDGRDYAQHGVFREIVPPRRIVYTFIWDAEPEHEMLVTVEFTERGNTTEMRFVQGMFDSAESRDGHEGGWNEAFDRLAGHLARFSD